jgi:hypothetical protein
MPTYRTEVGPEGEHLVMKCVLHVDGMWAELTDEQKAAWNRATTAINALADMAKKLRETVCKHAHCRESIYYSDFTNSWCHLSTAGESCPNNTVAEPDDIPTDSGYEGRW